METQLFLVRHGETDWNLARRVQGATDIPLNATGVAQAEATGRLLARRQWDAIYSSPLSRALHTARAIAAATGLGEPVIEPALVERSYGAAEGLDHDTIDRLFPGSTPVPGREHWTEVSARVVPALIAIAERHPGGRVLAVSHGGAIRSILRVLEPDIMHPAIGNGSVHSFRHLDGSMELVAFDDPIDHETDPGGDFEEQNPVESRES